MKTILAKIFHALNLSKSFQLFLMRFSQDVFLVGVTGIILNEQKEILLFKHTYRSHSWSLPGGYLKAGEHPREGLRQFSAKQIDTSVFTTQELIDKLQKLSTTEIVT